MSEPENKKENKEGKETEVKETEKKEIESQAKDSSFTFGITIGPLYYTFKTKQDFEDFIALIQSGLEKYGVIIDDDEINYRELDDVEVESLTDCEPDTESGKE